MRPVAVVGNLARDLIDGHPPSVGGGPTFAAQALRLLGRPAVIVTRCAEHDAAALLPPLRALGIPVRWLPADSTSTFAISYDGETREMRVEAAGATWRPEEVRGPVAAALRGVRWVHVAPLLRSDFPPETLAELARGRRVSYDGQGLVRVGEVGTLRLDADYDPELLRHVAVLKLAEEEAEAVLGEVSAATVAALGIEEVLVTLGPRGSIVFAGGRRAHVKAHPVHDVDPTGAGDAYMTTYIAARSEGHSPVSAARRATSLVSTLLAARRRRR